MNCIIFLAYFPYCETIKGGLWDHLHVCVSMKLQKARIVKREETAITLPYNTCNMWHDAWKPEKCSHRDVTQMACASQCIGNYVFQILGFCTLKMTTNHSPENRVVLFIKLHAASQGKHHLPAVPLLLAYFPCASLCLSTIYHNIHLWEHLWHESTNISNEVLVIQLLRIPACSR
jgi:hypothetical protein